MLADSTLHPMKPVVPVLLGLVPSALLGTTFPVTGNVVVVTQPPYSAKGDGVSDDTGAKGGPKFSEGSATPPRQAGSHPCS